MIVLWAGLTEKLGVVRCGHVMGEACRETSQSGRGLGMVRLYQAW